MPRIRRAVERGTGDEPDGNSMSRAEKRLESAQEETGGDGDGEEEEGAGRSRRTVGGLHRGGAPVSRAWFGAQDIGKGTAIPEWDAPG